MIEKVLLRLGVLAAGQTASAEDSTLVGGVLDSLVSQYRHRGLAPFATSAFPEWAQEPFAKIISADAGPYFGKYEMQAERKVGERELAEQMQGKRHGARIKARYY